LCCKDNCQTNFYWCLCPDLFKAMGLVPWCNFKATQVLVLCRWLNPCVGGMKHKYALDKLVIPKIWFIQNEINFLEEARFVLNNRQLIFPQSLFKGESSIPINRSVDEMSWP
jgi:hypothetical protein